MNPAIRALKPYPMAQLQSRKAAVIASGKALFDFGTGDPTEPTAPFIPEALRQILPAVSQYPSVAGTADLRDAVSNYLARRFQVQVSSKSHILPSAGSKEAIFHLALAFLDPTSGRDTVVYGTPAYPVYQSSALFAGGREHAVTLTRDKGYRLDLAALPADVLQRTAIAWINYPHNPTGACVDLAYLQAQVDVAKTNGILLASDECYQDLWYDGATAPPSILQITTAGVLAFHSCSKRSGMTGYRSGFIAGDESLIAAYRGWRAHFGVGSPTFIERAAALAWTEDTHVEQRRTIFAAKRAILVSGLEKMGIEVLPSSAGLYIWAKVPDTGTDHGDADVYAERCLDAGIVISPGGFFGNGGTGWFRLALVPSAEECRQALTQWPQ